MKTPNPSGFVRDRTFCYNTATAPRKPHWSFDPRGQQRLNRATKIERREQRLKKLLEQD